MTQIKSTFQKTLRFIILYILGKVAYITALAMLLPFVFLITLPEKLGDFSTSSSTLLLLGVLLIIIGIYSIYAISKKNTALMCKRLGRLTLIPGFVALLLLFVSKETMVNLLDGIIPQVENAQRIDFLLSLYINHAVPSVTIMMFAYLIIGFILWWYGRKKERTF